MTTGRPGSSGSEHRAAPASIVNGFAVIEPGLQTTVQDLGRPGHRHEGVPLAGALDTTSLALANALVGNEPNAAVLECTLTGPTLRVLVPTVVALAGADLGAYERGSGRRLAPLRRHRLVPGVVLAFAGAAPDRGCRAYLAVAGGGIHVPLVLGSRSTSLVGGFGGFHGRAVRSGDVLHVGGETVFVGGGLSGSPPAALVDAIQASSLPAGSGPTPVRVLPGELAAGPSDRSPTFTGLLASTWTIDPASDRRGLRLVGAALAPPVAADAPSRGVLPGTIQLTPSGGPLVLLADGGTTGGYPVVAVIIAADLPILGQLAPGSSVQFVAADLEEARRAEMERRSHLDGLAAALAGGPDPWEALSDLAGS